MSNSNQNSGKVVPFKRILCPMCSRPAAEPYQPFCSKRCANLDLGRWLSEGYRIPSDEEADLEKDLEEADLEEE